jgi:diguanylate cyclase (GGDEF)-like protein
LQEQATQEAHTLIGSLGSFGLTDASQLARQIQQLLKQDASLGQLDATTLEQLLQALRQAIPFDAEETSAPPTPPASSAPAFPTSSTLLIIDDDLSLATLLATEGAVWGLETAIATNLIQARHLIEQRPPNLVLLDLNLSKSGENGLDFLAELRLWHPDIPVLVFTAHDNMSDRVQAARLGCKGFFQKPIAPNQVLTAIVQVLPSPQQSLPKLLIVDDDPQLLTLLRRVLEPAGYQLTLLDQAHKFWETLEQTAPDLLILDMNLQGGVSPASSPVLELSGFDLCQIVRNDPQWGKLPIVFLSACMDPKTIQQGFEAGADDFLHKPIVPVELLTRVRKRLEQGQIRRQTELDALTGISNRRKALQDLTRLLRLAQRQKQPFCLAVLDLDHFKRINDCYGHEAGDRVLSYFGRLLSRSFRQEDVVGRWGGEEFVVGLYGTSKFNGANRLREVLHMLSQEPFTARDGTVFHVTFSGGIAQLLTDGTDLSTLYQSADAALYRAKEAGRNQVLEVEPI